MKQILIAVVALLCLTLPTGLRADFPIHSWVDAATASYVTGWATDIRTGVMPNHLCVLDDNQTTQTVRWLAVDVWVNGARPDVAAAFGVSQYVGYTAYYPPLPSGSHIISAFWDDFSGLSQSNSAQVIVP